MKLHALTKTRRLRTVEMPVTLSADHFFGGCLACPFIKITPTGFNDCEPRKAENPRSLMGDCPGGFLINADAEPLAPKEEA